MSLIMQKHHDNVGYLNDDKDIQNNIKEDDE